MRKLKPNGDMKAARELILDGISALEEAEAAVQEKKSWKVFHALVGFIEKIAHAAEHHYKGYSPFRMTIWYAVGLGHLELSQGQEIARTILPMLQTGAYERCLGFSFWSASLPRGGIYIGLSLPWDTDVEGPYTDMRFLEAFPAVLKAIGVTVLDLEHY
jgi:hypothetical protein